MQLNYCLVRHRSISLQTSNSYPTVVAVISVQHLTGVPCKQNTFGERSFFASLDYACVTGFLGA